MLNIVSHYKRLLIAGLFLCLIACRFSNPSPPPFGLENNAQREEIGLPIIPEDWEYDRVHNNECSWVNPERSEKKEARIPVHWSKYINYHTGDLLYETDTYFGSEDYVLEGDGTFRERLRITYYYQVDPYDYKERLGWDIEYIGPDALFGESLTLEEAEALLQEWGIERLE